jgi:hypothetical protein
MSITKEGQYIHVYKKKFHMRSAADEKEKVHPVKKKEPKYESSQEEYTQQETHEFLPTEHPLVQNENLKKEYAKRETYAEAQRMYELLLFSPPEVIVCIVPPWHGRAVKLQHLWRKLLALPITPFERRRFFYYCMQNMTEVPEEDLVTEVQKVCESPIREEEEITKFVSAIPDLLEGRNAVRVFDEWLSFNPCPSSMENIFTSLSNFIAHSKSGETTDFNLEDPVENQFCNILYFMLQDLQAK